MTWVVSIIGARPEVIKMAPVVMEMRRCTNRINLTVVATAQHRDMLDQILKVFDIVPDIDLDLMEANQTPASFASRALTALDNLFDEALITITAFNIEARYPDFKRTFRRVCTAEYTVRHMATIKEIFQWLRSQMP